jgi:predicted transcriptional regulator
MMLDLAKELNRFKSPDASAAFSGEGQEGEWQDVLQQFSDIIQADHLSQPQIDSALVALIMANYVRRHDVPMEQLPSLIAQVREALRPSTQSGQSHFTGSKPSVDLVPAVPVEASVAPDFIICLEDGRSCKSLKRYLRDHFSMTPEMYRTRWGLPEDYPMVAPNFSRRRAEIARQNKLGRYSRL